MPFHPYHFIPVTPASHPETVSMPDFNQGKVPHLTHDRYLSVEAGRRYYSGRIICNLETWTPLIIGASQDSRAEPAEVMPFKLPDGTPAIPASTLRGLISSLAEAASNSALRILSLQEPAGGREAGWPCFKGAPGFPANFFADISLDVLPVGLRAPQSGDRQTKRLTVAEQLFGFVEQGKSEAADTGMALAGRVKFAFGRLQTMDGNPFMEPHAVPLVLLGSPNPLSASLYFKRKDGRGGLISGPSLNRSEHTPQGRKQYLHHEDPQPSHWQDPQLRHRTMQVRAHPLKAGLVFQFHLDFDNLTATELGLISYALQPTPRYYHKLGLGKPIGLGTVAIDPITCLLIDRKKRYLQAPFAMQERYHERWIGTEPSEAHKPYTSDALSLRSYPAERAALDAANMLSFDLPKLASEFRSAMVQLAPDIIQSLELLGEEALPPAKIAYTVPSQTRRFLPPLPHKDASGEAQIPSPRQ